MHKISSITNMVQSIRGSLRPDSCEEARCELSLDGRMSTTATSMRYVECSIPLTLGRIFVDVLVPKIEAEVRF